MINIYQKAFNKGLLVAQVANFSRYLSDMPASDMYPERFVKAVIDELSLFAITNVTYQVLSLSEMEKLGMGGIIGVGKGSTKDAALCSALGEYLERISNNYL